jgi:hypothetical protein
MSVQRSLLTAAIGLALWSPGNARAADVSPPAPGPTVENSGYCPSCNSGLASFVSGLGTCKSCGSHHSCSSCGAPLLHSHTKGPYVTNLCPGACFGYFQTQWRKWEDVCPYPYQGTGVGDAPKTPAAYLPSGSDRIPTKKPDGTLPDPRLVDPKNPGGLPPIPPIGGKN